jgi:hypothetical protein
MQGTASIPTYYHPMTFPCIVYERKRPQCPFVFSHLCFDNKFRKPFPKTLAFQSVLEHRKKSAVSDYYKHVGVVLVCFLYVFFTV